MNIQMLYMCVEFLDGLFILYNVIYFPLSFFSGMDLVLLWYIFYVKELC